MSSNEQPKEPSQKSEWTPEAVMNLIKLLDTILGKYITFKQNESKAYGDYFATAARHNKNLLIALTFFLTAIVALMSVLTYWGRVSGDALLFLVGTITGYVILFIQRLVRPAAYTPPATQE